MTEPERQQTPWLRMGKVHIYADRWAPTAWQVVRTVDGPGFVIDLGHLSVAVTWGEWS